MCIRTPALARTRGLSDDLRFGDGADTAGASPGAVAVAVVAGMALSPGRRRRAPRAARVQPRRWALPSARAAPARAPRSARARAQPRSALRSVLPAPRRVPRSARARGAVGASLGAAAAGGASLGAGTGASVRRSVHAAGTGAALRRLDLHQRRRRRRKLLRRGAALHRERQREADDRNARRGADPDPPAKRACRFHSPPRSARSRPPPAAP